MPQRITSIEELRALAKKRVPRMFYDYVDSGAWTGSTYEANETDFGRIKLRQRVAVDISNRSLATTMVGQQVSMPVALAPTGIIGMQRGDGEILVARAAEKAGIPYTLSTMSVCSIEDVAENTQKPFWFQLYVMKDRDFIGRLIDRAKKAGCSALVLTLDLQIIGQRHKDIKNGLTTPPKLTLAMFSISPQNRAGASACSEPRDGVSATSSDMPPAPTTCARSRFGWPSSSIRNSAGTTSSGSGTDGAAN